MLASSSRVVLSVLVLALALCQCATTVSAAPTRQGRALKQAKIVRRQDSQGKAGPSKIFVPRGEPTAPPTSTLLPSKVFKRQPAPTPVLDIEDLD